MQPPTESPKNQDAPRGFPQAVRTLLPWQKAAILLAITAVAAGAATRPLPVIIAINAGFTLFYLVNSAYRIFLMDLSLRRRPEITVAPAELQAPPPGRKQWPKYLVLVPLYREAEILPHLVTALSRLDYPKDRLEIRLLIEEDDLETMAAARSARLPPPFVIFPIPVSQPRTKPKACNVGMAAGEAEFLVVYDAEDRPEPDQLKKAVTAFSRVPDNVACIQAKLNFYNPGQNILTRCFTAEYALWFDLFLPGLDCLEAPIPLGGTSNHFRLRALREIGGWDEFNVTEDCDLGLRLFTRGWRTRMLDSTTWEQACPSLPFWIRQRSRWVKGYIQTYFVHTRRPFGILRSAGWRAALHFHLLVGGTPLSQLINPFYWLLAAAWFLWRPESLSAFFPWPVFAMGAVCLFLGNFLFAYAGAVACVRRGLGHLAGYALLMPLYWGLMSVGAWKGALQLLVRPHHWEKTRHFAASQDSAAPGKHPEDFPEGGGK